MRLRSHAHWQIPLLILLLFSSILLTVLYSVDIMLPSIAGSACWIGLGLLAFLIFRWLEVPVLSLSRIALTFFLYIAVAYLWTVLFPQVLIAYHAHAFQTQEIFAKVHHLVSIGVSAQLAGWLITNRLTARSGPQRIPATVYPVGPSAFYPAVVLSIPFLLLSLPNESILTAAYGSSDAVGAVLQINVLKSAAILCILLGLVAYVQAPSLKRKVTIGSLFVVLLGVNGVGSGNRVEEIGCLFGVAWILHGIHPRKSLPRSWIVSAVILCVLMLAVGELRTSLAAGPVSFDSIKNATREALRLVPDAETLQMKPSTNGDIGLTLCVVVGLVDTNILQIDYGNTFVQYARMTLPRFLNADRPDELQVTLSRMGLTGGGLYVLAEPYAAGGAIGVFLVMLTFGGIIGWLEAKFTTRRMRSSHYLLYLLLLSCVPRWYLYSILSMYKHVVTGLLLFVLVSVATRLFSRLERPYELSLRQSPWIAR